VLTGLLAGLIITLVVVSVLWIMNRRRRASAAGVLDSVSADQAHAEDTEPVDGRKAA
jgi:hypothetical protein